MGVTQALRIELSEEPWILGNLSDPEIAALEPTIWSMHFDDERVGTLASATSPRTAEFPIAGTYLALDPAAMNFLASPQASADFQSTILSRFAKSNVVVRLDFTEGEQSRVIKVHGFRWCDSNADGSKKVFELAGLHEALEFAPKPSSSISLEGPTVYLATGSQVKWAQYGYLFRSWGVNLEWSRLSQNVSEPQVDGTGRSSESVLVQEPLKQVARWAKQMGSYPLLLEDTMLFIEHFNEDFENRPILPGPDTKRWWAALQSGGILKLMEGSPRRRAKFVAQLGVLDEQGGYKVFRAEVLGSIAERVRESEEARAHVPFSNPYNFHNIFIPDGSHRTYAEMMPGEFRKFDYRSQCVDGAIPWLLQTSTTHSFRQLDFDIESQ